MNHVILSFLQGTVRTATPLALAALGEVTVERSGIINIGLEGSIISGALGALVGAEVAGIPGGVGAAALSGAVIAGGFAVFTVWLRADQIIVGTAVTLFSFGLTGTLYRWLYGVSGVALTAPTMRPTALPVLSSIPVVGPILFFQTVLTYCVYILVPVAWWWLYHTHAGLALRATGEEPSAALVAGISPKRVQFWAVLFGGSLGGLAGAALVLAQAGTFVEGMSAGRGFIAIAIVVLGRWHPAGVGAAALLFGAASMLQFVFQALGTAVPYQLFLAFPYLLTLVVLTGAAGYSRPPAALARRRLKAI
ncbi:MAG: ABC transporter permease [Chloroflexota bacterium]